MNFSDLFTIYLSGSAGKEYACYAGDLGSIPGLGRSLGEGKSHPLQYFWPEEFHELYSPRGHKELDMTERLSLSSWDSIVMIVLHFLFYSNELF